MHGECTDDVPVAGYELTLAVLDVGQWTEAVDLQFEDEQVGVEWFSSAW